jgi:hypothetical protein
VVSPSPSLSKVKKIVTENPNLTLKEIAAQFSVSQESIRTILTNNLGMKHVASRLGPKDLNYLQKLNRMRIAEDMLERVNFDSKFMKSIVTGDEIDETTVYELAMQTSQQASQRRFPTTEPKPKKPRQSCSKVKVMLTAFLSNAVLCTRKSYRKVKR